MGMLFSKPVAPAPAPAPKPAPAPAKSTNKTSDNAAAKEAEKQQKEAEKQNEELEKQAAAEAGKERQEALRKKGWRSTILTGPASYYRQLGVGGKSTLGV